VASKGLNFTPPGPVARAFMVSMADSRGIVGPYGSGKSTACIVELLRQNIMMPPGEDGIRRSRVLVVRNTKQQLKDITLASVVSFLPVEIYHWKESEMKAIFRFNDVHAEWLFRSLDSPEDIQRVLGSEVTWIWTDECREVPVALLPDLEARAGRFPSQGTGFTYRHGTIYSTNPPEIDSDWYKVFEGLPQDENDPESIFPMECFKQPSGLSLEAENKNHLREGYYEKLARGKKKDWVDVYVHGRYSKSMSGKPVYEISFQYDRRVKHNLKWDPILPVVIGVDTARQPAMVFMQLGYDGKLRKFKEACGFDMGAKTFIATKLKPLIKNCFSSNPLIFIGDPSWKTRDNTDDNSWYKELKKQFVTDMPGSGNVVKSADTNDPIARINALDDPFRNMWPDGEPGIEYDASCTLLVEGLRSKYRYVRIKTDDGKFQDKPEKNKWSHVCEADQYGTMFILGKHYNASEYVRTTFDRFTNTTTTRRAADAYSGY